MLRKGGMRRRRANSKKKNNHELSISLKNLREEGVYKKGLQKRDSESLSEGLGESTPLKL